MRFRGPEALNDKQGNSLLRFLLVEAAQAAARINPHWRRRYMHLAMRRHKSIAKVAMGRRMAVRLYWMWHVIGHPAPRKGSLKK